MIKKAMRRFLKDRMTSFLIVLIVFSILIQAIPANAIDLRISNDALANEALSHPIGSDGGTCKEFVKHVFNSVAAAVGSSLRIGSGYRACYLNAGGVEVSGSDAVRGDFIQINKDSDPKNYYSGMHSAIVLENYHNGSFLVIDSNWNWDEKVRTHTWNPTAYAISKGLSAHFYRLGTIAPPTPAYAWQFISQTASKDLVGLSPGETVTVTLTAKNVGSATWYKSGANPVRVGTTNPRERPSTFANSTWLGSNRPTGLPVDQVKQGETVTFSWTITAPSTPGEYREHYSLVAEGIAWMNDPGINYYIVVNNRSYDYDEHYYVWRDADQALNRSVGIVAQSFKAKFPLIKSVSFNGANVSGGKVYVKIFSNEGQTQQVGSTKEVIVNNYGETTAIWDEPIPVNVGNTYWLQILPPEGTKMTIYFSKYNEYSEGSLYLDWTKESSYDLNSSVRRQPDNVSPTANAGPDQTVNEGTTVNLSGNGTDPDGDTLSYNWTQTQGPAVTLNNSNTSNASFTAPEVTTDTTLTFKLTVDDGKGGTATDTVDITVKNIIIPPSQANLYIDLPTTSVASVGQQFTVDVKVKDITNFYGYQFDIAFDSQYLEAVSVVEGDFLKSGGSTFFNSGTINNTSGLIDNIYATLLAPAAPVSGGGTLVKVTFRVKKMGEAGTTTPIGLADDLFSGPPPEANLILHTTTGSEVYFKVNRAPIQLYKGWNSIALPINPSTPLTAQSLLDLINSQGGDATQIAKWDKETQSWIIHINNVPINDFEIKPDEGYFIKSNKNSEFTLTGTSINSPVPISFFKNWNLAGIPYPANKYTAQTLLDEINKQDGDATLIAKWDKETQSWIIHINNLPINNFEIKPDEGYFIKTGKASEFVP